MPLTLDDLDPSDYEVEEQESPKTLDDLDEGSYEVVEPDVTDSVIGGAAQGMTLGHADEMTAGIGAVYDYLEAKSGNRGDISFKDAYQTRVEAIRNRDQDLKAANPSAYKSAEFAGAIAPALVTGGSSLAGQGALRTGAVATGAGLAAGSGYSEGDIGSGEHAFDTALGGALGLGTFGALKGAGAMANSNAAQAAKQKGKEVLEKLGIPEGLREFAEQRAVKAATGQNKKALKQIAARKGGIEGLGRKLLDDKTVKAGRSVSEIAKTAEKQKKVAGEAIDEIFERVDEQLPDAFDPANVSEKLMAYAEELNTPNTQGLYNNVMKQAESYLDMGKIGLKQAQHLKNTYNYKPGNAMAADTLPQHVQNKMKMIIGEEIDDTIRQFSASKNPGMTNLADIYKGVKADYGAAATVAGDASERAIGDLSNRFVSLTDYGAGAMAMGTSGNPQTAIGIGKGMLGAAGNKLARSRGNSTVAITADKLANMLSKAPKKFGPYMQMLLSSADRGSKSLGATHQILWRNDPKYRSLLSGKQFDEEGNYNQAAKSPPYTYEPKVSETGMHSKMLLKAKERGGSEALNATHNILMQTDPKYRAKYLRKMSK